MEKAKKQIRNASNQTQNTKFASQRNQCRQQYQTIKRQERVASGINGAVRAAFWPTSKAIQIESIEDLILLEDNSGGPTVYYCDYVTNVTYKIQCKYPDIKFERCFVEN